MTKEKIAKVDLIVYSLEQRVGSNQISIRARKEGEGAAYIRNSFFFEMESPCKPPRIGEAITVTVELDRYYKNTTDAAPETTNTPTNPTGNVVDQGIIDLGDSLFATKPE